MAKISELYRFFSSAPLLNARSIRILEASTYATIFGRSYTVDNIGLDLCALVGDDARGVRSYMSALACALPDLRGRVTDSIEISPFMLAKTTYENGTCLYQSDIKMVKAVVKSMARRSALSAIYIKSGTGMLYDVSLNNNDVSILWPSVTSLVCDDNTKMISTLQAGRDLFFSRYIHAIDLERNNSPAFSPVGVFSVSSPSSACISHLSKALHIAKTLEDAEKWIEVVWSMAGRRAFDDGLYNRWDEGETHSEMTTEAYKKIKKLAALFAVARDMYKPVISEADVLEALGYLDIERKILDDKIESVDLRSRRKELLLQKMRDNLNEPYQNNISRNSKPFLHALGMVTAAQMFASVSGLKCFASDPDMTKKQAFDQSVRDLVRDGAVEILPDDHALAVGGGENGKGRIFSDIIYVKGYHTDKISQWK